MKCVKFSNLSVKKSVTLPFRLANLCKWPTDQELPSNIQWGRLLRTPVLGHYRNGLAFPSTWLSGFLQDLLRDIRALHCWSGLWDTMHHHSFLVLFCKKLKMLLMTIVIRKLYIFIILAEIHLLLLLFFFLII